MVASRDFTALLSVTLRPTGLELFSFRTQGDYVESSPNGHL